MKQVNRQTHKPGPCGGGMLQVFQCGVAWHLLQHASLLGVVGPPAHAESIQVHPVPALGPLAHASGGLLEDVGRFGVQLGVLARGGLGICAACTCRYCRRVCQQVSERRFRV